MSDVTPEELAAIRERAESATPGPWVHADDTLRNDGSVEASNVLAVGLLGLDPWQVAASWAGSIPPSAKADQQACANAEFIAHTREDVPRLLDALRATVAERDAARAFERNVRHVLIATERKQFAAEADRDALARKIAAAPHDTECKVNWTEPSDHRYDDECDCWKADTGDAAHQGRDGAAS